MLLRFSNPQSHQKIYVTHVLHCNSLLKSGAKVLLFGYMGNTLSKKVLRKKVVQGIAYVDSFVIACARVFNIRCELPLIPSKPDQNSCVFRPKVLSLRRKPNKGQYEYKISNT